MNRGEYIDLYYNELLKIVIFVARKFILLYAI